MLLSKKKNQAAPMGSRFLITITVLGSAGPIRFVVNEKDPVAAVMDTALKSYSRQGRLPILGSNLNDFLLYCPSAGRTEALNPWETIGSIGSRNFMLCKKPRMENSIGDDASSLTPRKSAGNWKTWFNKSLNLRISSH